jgi:glycosyltransferase involved in cell wall biosynthesis
MRICYIGDANAIHTRRWVEWFARDHDVTVVATTAHPGLERYRIADLPRSGVPLRLPRSLADLLRILRRADPDVLHCHFINEAGWFGAASGWRPLVITAWGSDVYRAPRESRLAGYLNPWSVRRADAVTCDSQDQARVMRSWGVPAERLAVIGWGVDLEEFHPGIDGGELRAELDIPAQAPLVLSPRQWYPNSNIPTVVAAHELLPDDVYLLLKRAPAFELDGGAPVERVIRASRARQRIRVLGEIPATRLPSLYAAASAVVSLCSTDGTPVSVLEAMALGLPIVALETASLSEWIAPPGGVLVKTLDPAPVAAALNGFLHEAEARQRAAQYNCRVVESRANRKVEFGRMAEIYTRLAGSGAKR